MTAKIEFLYRAPAAWLAASAGFGLGALVLMFAGATWPLPALAAAVQAGLLAAGVVALHGDSAGPEGGPAGPRSRA